MARITSFSSHVGRDLTSNLEALLGLKAEGEIAYVLKRGDGLWTIKGNDHHGGGKWVQIAGPNPGETMAPGKAKLRDAGSAAVEPETAEEQLRYELGWYQDQKGSLYQYDGDQWTDGKKTVLVSKSVYETLEYLG